ncbi:MAG: signal peptide peptidase SppA [Ardenticatenaceae bacterium]|nr:signal peptide peptidase SppA [Ardenticatenaceae bacterium]
MVQEPTPPQVIQIQPEKNRTALWILIAVSVGFLLPVCACAVFMLTAVTSLTALASDSSSTTTSSGSGDAIAIVRVEGAIFSSDDPEDFAAGAGSGVVIADLQKAVADPTVKAIVLRVDSPGGSVTGSAQIYEFIRDLEKPIVVSMAATAASGGYYISAPADYIFARPDTVTGSIGVIMTLFNAEELIDEIGVDVINITSGPNKAIGSTWDELTPEQRDILEAFIDEAYDDFVQIIVDGRSLDEDTVRQIADGRIYSGRQAQANGLVDELGDLQAAISKAADLGGISGEPRIVEYEHLPSLESFLTGLSSRLNQSQADQALQAIEEFTLPAIEYRYVGPASQ